MSRPYSTLSKYVGKNVLKANFDALHGYYHVQRPGGNMPLGHKREAI
jgi:hypothetical protein